MFDFLKRALRHPSDYLPVLSWHKVILLRREERSPGIYSFIFKKPTGLRWKSGQHGVWWFLGEHLPGGAWRAFSIASSCHENEIRISTTVPEKPSAFKQKLLDLSLGDTIWLQGPFGEFHGLGKTELIGVAGGIGITPLRALAYDITHGHLPSTTLTLIYSAAGTHTHKDDLDAWMQLSPQLTVIYVSTPEEVNAALAEQIANHGNRAHYCISGSPGMIKAITETCQKQGITNIISDPFKGY